MWTCSEMKKRGWQSLQRNFWLGVLLTFVFIVITIIPSVVNNSLYGIRNYMQLNYLGELFHFNSNFSNFPMMQYSQNSLWLGLVQSFVSFILFAATFLLINPIIVGYSRWFLVNRQTDKEPSIGELFSTFHPKQYGHVVGGTAWKVLWTWLWGMVASFCMLPAIVFGIIALVAGLSLTNNSDWSWSMANKNFVMTMLLLCLITFVLGLVGFVVITFNRRYAYLFTEFILADNPHINATGALTLSKQMTAGQKMQLFMLDLSFLGWWILSALTCFILNLGIIPYVNATYAEVYVQRKNDLQIKFS